MRDGAGGWKTIVLSTRKDLGGFCALPNPPERWERAKGCPGFLEEEAAKCSDTAEEQFLEQAVLGVPKCFQQCPAPKAAGKRSSTRMGSAGKWGGIDGEVRNEVGVNNQP